MEIKSCKHNRKQEPCGSKSIKMHHKSLYWLSTSILKLLLLVTQMQLTYASDVIRVGGLFDLVDTNQETAFRQAVVAVNKDKTLLPNTRLAAQVKRVPPNDSYKATRKVCSVIKSGVGAIFGPRSGETSAHIQSICDNLEIPHIENRWNFQFTRDDYSVNLYPHASTLAKAHTDVLKSLGWKKFSIIYENNNGLIRVQELIKDEHFHVSLKQLPLSGDYRPMLEEVKKEGVTHIVLDVERENIFTVLKQAQQVGMMTDYHNYFITSLDLATVDLEDFRHGGTNMSALRLVDPHNPVVENNNESMQTEVALMYDAVQLFAKALDDLNRSRRIDITPLECDGNVTSNHGTALLNYIKMVQINGLTGVIRFDSEGFRTDVTLDVVELSKDGLKRIGRWDRTSGVNYSRTHKDVQEVVTENLQDKTLIVSMLLNDPYIMLRHSSVELTGNDRYEGFCIDLIHEISNLLGFNYSLVLPPDGRYGVHNKQTNQWNGMIGELLNLRADIAIADMTITSEREKAVDFTMPWMNLGISVLYVKPIRIPPSMFVFLYPFTVEMWICLPFAYLGVTLLLFALARLSPYERVADSAVNQFTCDNSMWFIWGSLHQQKTDHQPRAVSTRIVAGTWWLFTLIMICSYTASLVTFYKVSLEREHSPIESYHDLASQTEIQYGTVKGGSTMAFFRDSKVATYQKMFSFMESQQPSVNVDSYQEGVERVSREHGRYAFLMESSSLEYIVERHCDLVQVGGLLDSKQYGFALPPGSPYRQMINDAILQLFENGRVEILKQKWFKIRRGGGKCKERDQPDMSSMPAELGLQNVGGVFVILLVGMGLAVIVAIFEFIWKRFRTPVGVIRH